MGFIKVIFAVFILAIVITAIFLAPWAIAMVKGLFVFGIIIAALVWFMKRKNKKQ